MKKLIVLILSIVILITSCTPPSDNIPKSDVEDDVTDKDVQVNDETDLDKYMGYASGKELTRVYESIQKAVAKRFESTPIILIEGTLTPIYTVDLFEYAETEEFKLKPLNIGEANQLPDYGYSYYIKTLVSDNKFGGNLLINMYKEEAQIVFTHSDAFVKEYLQDKLFPTKNLCTGIISCNQNNVPDESDI